MFILKSISSFLSFLFLNIGLGGEKLSVISGVRLRFNWHFFIFIWMHFFTLIWNFFRERSFRERSVIFEMKPTYTISLKEFLWEPSKRKSLWLNEFLIFKEFKWVFGFVTLCRKCVILESSCHWISPSCQKGGLWGWRVRYHWTVVPLPM